MKIGIINFHCAHNYGAMLQAYALQKILENLNHDVEIIDFEPEAIFKGYKIWNKDMIYNPRLIGATIKNYYRLKVKYNIFENFRKNYFNLTDKCYKNSKDLQSENFNYDACICGSDQVWNMDLNGNNKAYLLNFIDSNNTLKISYAASIGTKKIPYKYIKSMKKELDTFNSISVREEDALEIIEKEFDIKATQVLDPVFLLSKEEWVDLSITENPMKEPYVLLYGLEENELFEKYFKMIVEEAGMKIINISPHKNKSKYIYKNIYNVGPREFLGLISKASLVFTNSFHGTCFSIIFNKPFFTLSHSNLNSRIENILKLSKLEKHMINYEINDIDKFNKIINYYDENTYTIINNEIKKSKKFLNESLALK